MNVSVAQTILMLIKSNRHTIFTVKNNFTVVSHNRFRPFKRSSSGVKGKVVPLHAMEALGGRGGIAPTHSRPRH
jgi:hypothetical protein